MNKGRWFHQTRLGGLGNFIMCTPALQLLSQKKKEKINVYFESGKISTLYKECPFINILNKQPKIPPFGGSTRPQRIGDESDIEATCRVLNGKYKKIPNTYVDNKITLKLDKKKGNKYIAVFHGCLGSGFVDRKDIRSKTRQYIIDEIKNSGNIPVILGNKVDIGHYWKSNNLEDTLNFLTKLSLRDSVSILYQCDYFISNDTGLYHVAAAFEKEGLVLWRNTNFIKNKEMFSGIKHCISKEGQFKCYKKAIDESIEAVK